jgi:hypothetical protein
MVFTVEKNPEIRLTSSIALLNKKRQDEFWWPFRVISDVPHFFLLIVEKIAEIRFCDFDISVVDRVWTETTEEIPSSST